MKFTPAQTAKLNEYIREIRPGVTITLSFFFLEIIFTFCIYKFPAYRLHKELGVPYGTCHSDFARIHSDPSPSIDYCVEVKPKQGWCVKSVLDESTKLCTFCLNQFLKVNLNSLGFSKITKFFITFLTLDKNREDCFAFCVLPVGSILRVSLVKLCKS